MFLIGVMERLKHFPPCADLSVSNPSVVQLLRATLPVLLSLSCEQSALVSTMIYESFSAISSNIVTITMYYGYTTAQVIERRFGLIA